MSDFSTTNDPGVCSAYSWTDRLIDYNSTSQIAFTLQSSDIALRDLYKLANVARSVDAQKIVNSIDIEMANMQRIAEIAKKTSDLRNYFRELTQSKLTPLSRVLSRLLDKHWTWQSIIAKYGDPFNELLPQQERLAAANRIIEKSSSSSPVMNGLQIFGKCLLLLNVALSSIQIGRGLKKLELGNTGEGILDVTEGGVGVGLTIGVYSGLKTGAIVVLEGTGTLTFFAGILASGGLWLGFEESRRALSGEKTLAVEAAEYWAQFAIVGEERGGVKGVFEQAAGYTFGSLAALIAYGQGNGL